MHNIKLTIEYDGTKYCGWQKQRVKRFGLKKKKQKLAIQEVIESCIKKVLRQKVNIISSGRTDSGVHALKQVANFKTTSKIGSHKIKLALNGNLPKDIRISEAERVSLKFHSRYSAKSKVYRYIILNQDHKSPFLVNYSYWFKFPLDIRLMKKAASNLLGRNDFKAFCASGSSVGDTKRSIKRLSIANFNYFSYNVICIEIEADGFLYNMVRNIVGTLIEVGRGRFIPKDIKKIIESRDRTLAGPCAPAKGLFLIGVKY